MMTPVRSWREGKDGQLMSRPGVWRVEEVKGAGEVTCCNHVLRVSCCCFRHVRHKPKSARSSITSAPKAGRVGPLIVLPTLTKTGQGERCQGVVGCWSRWGWTQGGIRGGVEHHDHPGWRMRGSHRCRSHHPAWYFPLHANASTLKDRLMRARMAH